jgi:hypothetical protein
MLPRVGSRDYLGTDPSSPVRHSPILDRGWKTRAVPTARLSRMPVIETVVSLKVVVAGTVVG